MEGYIPYVNTIATFITRRCYEQVAVDLCLHDLPVRLIGSPGQRNDIAFVEVTAAIASKASWRTATAHKSEIGTFTISVHLPLGA